MGGCSIVVEDIIVRDAGPECANACPVDALRVVDGRLVAEPSLCLACVACMAVCGPDRVEVVSGWRCG